MNVVLATVHLEPSTRAVPLAAACLKAMAGNHEAVLRNYYVSQPAAWIARSIFADSPAVVGFPVYLWNRSLVIETIDLLKKEDPDLTILAGGPEVTADPESFLRSSRADILMQGEGEPIISPILDALAGNEPVPRLPGVWTGSFKPAVPSIAPDFDRLPSPLLSGSLDLSESPGLLWELSRGCPFACDFCFESKGAGKNRSAGLDRIRKELKMIREHGIEQVFVLDPTFNAGRKRVLDVLALIREYTPGTYYYFEARSEFIDQETAEAFSQIPCTLQIGLQSGSPGVLKKVNRTLDPEDFRGKMEILSRNFLSYGLDLIYGLPGDTLEGFRASLDYALSLEPNHLDLFPLAVLPGTVLYDRAGSLGLHAQKEDPYTIVSTEEMPESEIKAAKSLSEAVDLLYNRGRAVSWFTRVCREMEMAPIELIDRWVLFKGNAAMEEEVLQEDILRFLGSVYGPAGKEQEFRLLRDVIRFLEIQAFLEERQETSASPQEGITLDESTRIVRHSSVRVVKMGMPPDCLIRLLETGGGESALPSEDPGEDWVFWSRDWEMCYERVDPSQASLLALLERPQSVSELMNASCDPEGVKDFLLESLLEGLLLIL